MPLQDDGLDPAGSLSRLITESGHATVYYVKPKAFEPKYDVERGRFETSVFATDGLVDREVWEIAERHVESTRGKRVFARARIVIQKVETAGLRADVDEPPARHCVIVGWPDGSENKPKRQQLQQELARVASLHRRPLASGTVER